MKKKKGRVLALLLAVLMVFGMMPSFSLKAYAASGVSISTPISSSIDQQIFVINSSKAGEYEAYVGDECIGYGEFGAGSTTLTYNTSEEVGLYLYTPSDDGGRDDLTYADSLNSYYATVYFRDTQGNDVFEKDVITLGKYANNEVEYITDASVDAGGVTYYCPNNIHVLRYGNTSYTFTYTASEKPIKTIPVFYVDENDQEIFKDSISLAYGESKDIAAPATYTTEAGSTYTLQTQSPVTASYDNAADAYTFEYVKEAAAPDKPYQITVNMVDADNDNAILYSTKMTVDIGGTARMELPAVYTFGQKQYRLADDSFSVIERPFESTEGTTYTVPYTLTSDASPYEITINCVDASNPGKILTSLTAVIEADGQPFSYDTNSAPTIEVNGETWLLVKGQGNRNGQIIHNYGDKAKVYNVTYTKEEQQDAVAYDITLRYIDLTSSTILHTETQTVAPGETVIFAKAPASLENEGVTYRLLNGQDDNIAHSYNEALQTSYAVYYVQGTELEEGQEEPLVNVVIEEVTQYVTDDNQNVAANENGTAVPQTVPVATVTDDNGNTIGTFDENGNEVTIDNGNITLPDEQVPLAQGPDLGNISGDINANDASTTSDLMRYIPVIAAVFVLFAGIIIIFIVRKRKNNKNQQQ